MNPNTPILTALAAEFQLLTGGSAAGSFDQTAPGDFIGIAGALNGPPVNPAEFIKRAPVPEVTVDLALSRAAAAVDCLHEVISLLERRLGPVLTPEAASPQEANGCGVGSGMTGRPPSMLTETIANKAIATERATSRLRELIARIQFAE